jgi:branched-chain amino acid transport system substrate-binding protein
VPCIFPSLGDSQIVMPPNECYAFTFPPSFALQAAELAKAMDAAGQETIAIVQDDSGISELISETFTAAFDDAGIDVTSKEVIPVNSQSVTSQVQRLGAANADAILDIVVAASLNALLVKEIDSAGLDATLYGINTLTDPQLRAQIGESIDGAISIDQIDRSSESFIEYSEYFAEQQGGDIEVLGHHIYATTALLVLKAAVESADSTDGPAIRDALQEISDFPAGFGQPGYTLNWKSDDHNGSTEAGIVFIEFDGEDITTWGTYQPTGKE